MKFCYQVATPDVAIAPSVTSYQGALEKSFQDTAALGYDQAELMTVDPDKLDWTDVKKLAEKYNLTIPLICTGEVYGQLGISFVDPDPARQKIALDRMRRIIDFASFLGRKCQRGPHPRPVHHRHPPAGHLRCGRGCFPSDQHLRSRKKCNDRLSDDQHAPKQLHQHHG